MKAKTLRSSKFRNSSPESKVWFRDTSSSSCWLFGDTYEHIHVVHVANSRISCIIPDVRLFWFRHIICSNQLWLWSWYGSSGSVAPLWFVDTPPRKLEVSSSRESESLCGERCAPRWGGRLRAALPSYPVLPGLPFPSEENEMNLRDEECLKSFANNSKAVLKLHDPRLCALKWNADWTWFLCASRSAFWVKQKRENSWDACIQFAQEIRSP